MYLFYVVRACLENTIEMLSVRSKIFCTCLVEVGGRSA